MWREIKRMATKLTARQIKPFSVDGIAGDVETVIRQRQELEERIIDDMRDKGYVPVLDITPEMYTDYIEKEENFRFAIIVYGVYVGKVRARKIMGTLGQHQVLFNDDTTE